MKKTNRAKTVFLMAGPFPAMAFFKIWAATEPASGSLTLVAFLMLLFCAVVVFFASRWDKPSYFDWTVSAYFALVCLLLVFWPDSAGAFLSRFSVTGIYVCLFVASFVPPLVGMDPFTCHYAKKSTPEPLWGNPFFVAINRIMTYVWAGVFAVATVLSLYPSVLTRALIPLAMILGFGLPFNLRFPDFYLKRKGLPSLKELKTLMGPGSGAARISPESHRDPEGQGAPVIGPPKSTAQENAKALSEAPSRSEDTRSDRGKENSMRVLALNSSPRPEGQSKTELLLRHLVTGMREAGAEVEVVDLRKKTIRLCAGCFTCWTKTPGLCIHKDDMSKELFPKFLASDLVVYGTPLYHYTVNAAMKAFIERTLPVLQPFFEGGEGGGSHHPMRYRVPKAMFLSVAGFPERSAFDLLSSWVRFVFGGKDRLIAEIYRPNAEALTVPYLKEKAREVLEATTQAGREIVQSMKISEETLARITQEIAPDRELFRKMGNLFWKSCIEAGLTPREFEERGLMPRPDSIETFMMILPLGFNPKGAGDVRAVIQFAFSGEVEGVCHFQIEDGKIRAAGGPAEKPDLTIHTPFGLWMDIMSGKANGQEMFMAQKYRVEGDLSLLIRMGQMFGK